MPLSHHRSGDTMRNYWKMVGAVLAVAPGSIRDVGSGPETAIEDFSG